MKIKALIESVYQKYHHPDYIGDDPVRFLHIYLDPLDREVVALLAALMAYGRVEQIRAKTTYVLSLLDQSPWAFLKKGNLEPIAPALMGFRHRFMSGDMLLGLFENMVSIIKQWGSLGRCFRECWENSGREILQAVSIYRSHLSGRFEKWGMILPDPFRGSACKRWFLFLRWMVRSDEIDPGGWGFIPKSTLMVPLDVHLHRVALKFGFTTRKSANLRTVYEITEALRIFDPYDPVRYDFSLTRWSMAGFPPLEGNFKGEII